MGGLSVTGGFRKCYNGVEMCTFYSGYYRNAYILSQTRQTDGFIGHQCFIKLTGLPYLPANPSFVHIFPY